MDLSVALAFATFPDAPKEVQVAAKEYAENFIVMKKSENQAAIWNEAKRKARSDNEQLLKKFQDAIEAWDPAGLNEKSPIETASLAEAVAAGTIKV